MSREGFRLKMERSASVGESKGEGIRRLKSDDKLSDFKSDSKSEGKNDAK